VLCRGEPVALLTNLLLELRQLPCHVGLEGSLFCGMFLQLQLEACHLLLQC
jgi:hypothetical protein